MNLTMIVILAIVIIVVSILMAFGKAVGAGGNVKDFFLNRRKKMMASLPKKNQNQMKTKQHNTPLEPLR